MPFELNRRYTRDEAAKVFHTEMLDLVDANENTSPAYRLCRAFVSDLVRYGNVEEKNDRISGIHLTKVARDLNNSEAVRPITKDYENQNLVGQILRGDLKGYVFKIANRRRVLKEQKEEFVRELEMRYRGKMKQLETKKGDTNQAAHTDLQFVGVADRIIRERIASSTSEAVREKFARSYRAAMQKLMRTLRIDYREESQ